MIEEQLVEYDAVLFSNLPFTTAAEVSRLIKGTTFKTMGYMGGVAYRGISPYTE